LLAFAAFASKQHIDWYLFGAQAVALYGVQRTTADLDVTIDLGGRALTELLGPLAKAGFVARFADRAFAEATRVLPVVHRSSNWPIDVVLAGVGLEQDFMEQRRFVTIRRTRIPLLSPEHLIATKTLAQRPRDLEDVRSLLRTAEIDHAKIDHAKVTAVLDQLEEALGQSDLRPLYARLQREAKSRL
jgi:hypothetical protein